MYHKCEPGISHLKLLSERELSIMLMLIVGVLNYPFKTLCLFIKLLLFSSLSYHYGLIFILLFALIFIHSCIVYGKT